MRGDDGAVDQGVLEVRFVGQTLEDAVKDLGSHPAAKALEHAVPPSGPLRQVAPGQAGAHPPQHRLEEEPVVLRGYAAVRGLAGQQRRDLLPDRVAHPKPVLIHPGRHSAKGSLESHAGSNGNPDRQRALI